MLILKREFSFCASHRLFNPQLSYEENVAIYGKCAWINGHGHNYRLEVAVTGQLNAETGMIIDLKILNQVVEETIIQNIDHKNLNLDVPWLIGKIPTTEVLVEAIWERVEKKLSLLPEAANNGLRLHSITVWETEKNVVTKKA